jgi:hypothetical protein
VLARQPVEAAEQPPPLRLAAEQTEVVPEHDDGVEDAERPVDVLEREDARVADAAAPAGLDRARRGVDRDHLAPALLEVQGDAPGAAADVEHAAADEPHRAALAGRPPARASRIMRP